MKTKLILSVLLLSACFMLNAYHEYWGEDGQGLAIRHGVNIEWMRTAATSSDGVVYVWSDTRYGGRDLWAQKIGLDGSHMWGEPVLVDNKLNRQEDPVAITSTDNCTIIAWVEYLHDEAGDVYAQKLSATGELLWDGFIADRPGVPVCVIAEEQKSLNIVPDNSGGAFILWNDMRSAGKDIYGTHLDADGNRFSDGWLENGNLIAGGVGDQYKHTFWEDAAGGAVLGFFDGVDDDLYAKRIAPDASITWSIDLAVAANSQDNLKICPAGNGNFAFAWIDKRSQFAGDLYAQIINGATGEAVLGRDLIVDNNFDTKKNPRVTIATDGGFYVVWERVVNSINDVYIQKISSDGSLLLNNEQPLALSVMPYHQKNSRITSDGADGCYVIWDDGRVQGYPHDDIYAQHILSDGSFGYNGTGEENGRIICDAVGVQSAPLVRVAGNKLFTVWGDKRTGSDGIYCQIINADGTEVLENNGAEVFWGLSGDATNAIVLSKNQKTYYIWEDSGYLVPRIMYQILDENGNIMLAENGVPIAPDVDITMSNPVADIADNGNIIVVWEQEENGYNRIYYQYILADGNLAAGNSGTAISDHDKRQNRQKVDYYDGAFYVGWSDMRINDAMKIWNQKIVAGVKQWGDAGVEVYAALPIEDSTPSCELLALQGTYSVWLAPDGFDTNLFVRKVNSADGSISEDWSEESDCKLTNMFGIEKSPIAEIIDGNLHVFWEDKRSGLADVYGQIVNADASRVWDASGLVFAQGAGDQRLATLSVDNGVFLSWTNLDSGENSDVLVQEFNMDGTSAWDNPINVVDTSFEYNDVDSKILVNNGYAYIIWEATDEDITDLYMQIINTDTQAYETDNSATGKPVCTALFDQGDSQLVYYDTNSVVAAWSDDRSSGKNRIIGLYTELIDHRTATDDNVNSYQKIAVSNYPNPFNTTVSGERSFAGTMINFDMPTAGEAQLSVYNVRGQKITTLHDGHATAGNNSVAWNGTDDKGQTVASGVYFYQVKTAHGNATNKMLIIR